MNFKTIISILILTTLVFSQDKNYAFDVSCGVGVGTSTSFPTLSASLSMQTKRIVHEISGEWHRKSSDNPGTYYKTNSILTSGFGFSYSYLFQTSAGFSYLGPTIGFFCYSNDKEKVFNNVHAHSSHRKNESGKYYCGGKCILIFGKSRVRLKIQDRLLFGTFETKHTNKEGWFGISATGTNEWRESEQEYEDLALGILNMLSIGVLFVF